MNNDFTSTYEYTVEQKPEGKFRLMRIGFMALYIIYPLIFMAVAFITQLFQLFALVVVTEWMLVFFTWKYAKPDEIPGPFIKFSFYGEFRENTVASMYQATEEELAQVIEIWTGIPASSISLEMVS